jgi:hypothetical protein
VSTIPRVVLCVAIGLTLTLACGDSPVNDVALTTAQAQRLGALRILFGHQSVGGNVIEGLADLARDGELMPLVVTRGLQVDSAGKGVIAHEWVGENGAPASKLAAVGDALAGPARGANVAIVKFCYSDFQADTDPDALFAVYRDQVTAWHARFPGVTFVHVTAPTVRPEGAAARLLRTLRGRLTMRARAAKVARYNERLREAYSGREPVIDLAAYESAGPFLNPEFTDDGQHLNEVGRKVVARRVLGFLADSVAPRVSR